MNKSVLISSLLTIILITIYVLEVTGQTAKTNTFLPQPTGKYIAGTYDLFLVDSSRKEIFTRRKNDFRRLYVKIWYPSDESYNVQENKYLEGYDPEIISKSYKYLNAPDFYFDSLVKEKTNSYKEIPVSKSEDMFPVIIFSQGYFAGLPDIYSCFMENLASNGYIIFSITHPYEQIIVNYPDGQTAKVKKNLTHKAFLQWALAKYTRLRKLDTPERIHLLLKRNFKIMKVFDRSLDIWVDDSRYLMNQLEEINSGIIETPLTRKIDLNKIGAMGQSFGGATAGQLCLLDKRVKAGINLDGFQFGDVYNNNINKPFMLIQSTSFIDWNIGNQMIYSNTTEPFYLLEIRRAKHYIFSDIAVLPNVPEEMMIEYLGNINPPKTMKTINNYILEFCNQYLKNNKSSLLMNDINNSDIIFKIKN